jgi:hypothetical protein
VTDVATTVCTVLGVDTGAREGETLLEPRD